MSVEEARRIGVLLVGDGRMGTLIARSVQEGEEFELVGTYGREDISSLKVEAPPSDVVIDFSHRAALPYIAAYVRRTGAALVSGTTGLDEGELVQLRALGELAPVIWSANYSVGVAVLRRLATQAASSLPGFDIEIVETHHNKKADAPSGTAKLLLEAVDPGHTASVVHGREGMVGARHQGEIGMHSLRGGTVAGTHELHFFGEDEELCLTHRATSRQIFANGALAAARRLMGRAPGFYDFDELMFD